MIMGSFGRYPVGTVHDHENALAVSPRRMRGSARRAPARSPPPAKLHAVSGRSLLNLIIKLHTV
jgi:hypothetical protein